LSSPRVFTVGPLKIPSKRFVPVFQSRSDGVPFPYSRRPWVQQQEAAFASVLQGIFRACAGPADPADGQTRKVAIANATRRFMSNTPEHSKHVIVSEVKNLCNLPALANCIGPSRQRAPLRMTRRPGGWLLTDSRQLFAAEHIDDAVAADAALQDDGPAGGLFDLADAD